MQPLVGDTVFTWDSVSGWPTVGDFFLRLDNPALTISEIVKVTSVNVGANQTTVVRAQEGTSASGSFVINSTGGNDLTAQTLADAMVRLDTSLSQTLTGPLAIPTALGAAPAATSFGTVPIKFAETLLGAPAASVSFTSIPATFRHLLTEWYARGDTAAASTAISLRVNNISTATYDQEQLIGNGGTASATENLGTTQIGVGNIPANTATANYFGGGEVKIPHYAGAVGNKPAFSNFHFWTADTTGTGQRGLWGGKWRTTATAINRADFLPGAGNFVTGSLFTVWLEP